MKIRRLVQGAAAIGAVAFVGASALSASAANGVGGGPIAQSVLGSGSDTTQFMMQDLDDIYRFSSGCAQIPTQPNPPTTVAWLDFSCQAPDPVSATHVSNTTLGSEIVTVTDQNPLTDVKVGDQVTGPGIPAGTPGPTNYVGGVGVAAGLAANQFFISNSPTVSDPTGAQATTTQVGVSLTFSHVRSLENYAHD